MRLIITSFLLSLASLSMTSFAVEQIPYDKNSASAQERKAKYRNIAKALTDEDRATWKMIGSKYRNRIVSETKGLSADEQQAVKDRLNMQMLTELFQNISPEAVQAIMATRNVREGHEPLSGNRIGETIQ